MATPYPLHIDRPIVLASGSPRRRELLALLNVDFEVVVPDVDETRHPGESPVDLVTRLAVAKAEAVSAARPDTIVVGADTAVELDGEILGKPIDAADAARMLRLLSGRSHRVHSGVAVADRWFVATGLRTSEVTFKALTEAEVDWYVATGEPLDKAGAYAVQGAGGAFVTSLNGGVSNVIGLPLDALTGMLSQPTGR